MNIAPVTVTVTAPSTPRIAPAAPNPDARFALLLGQAESRVSDARWRLTQPDVWGALSSVQDALFGARQALRYPAPTNAIDTAHQAITDLRHAEQILLSTSPSNPWPGDIMAADSALSFAARAIQRAIREFHNG